MEKEITVVGADPDSLQGTNLMVILSDEGGLPIYTRYIHVDDSGEIDYSKDPSINPKDEKILLLSGLIEAIMQLKDIIQPTMTDLTNKPNLPLYVDYAKAENGIALFSIATTPDFQKLPSTLLNQYAPQQLDTDPPDINVWEKSFTEALGSPVSEDLTLYRNILNRIKSDIAEFISFILVYDEQGNYLFSTAKHKELFDVADPLLDSISQYIKNEYVNQKYRENLTLIGAKRLENSVIWHFKCQDKIFVFFTYIIPDLHDFETLKSEMITFISNNLGKFIKATKIFTPLSDADLEKIKSTRFIFLS